MKRAEPGAPRTLRLKNKKGGRHTVTLRIQEAGDEEGMIACIRDEYGTSYFKREFYDPAYLREAITQGHMLFLIAQTETGEIAGMLLLKEFVPEESMCEIASLIFRKKYRGYGLAMPFFEYGMHILLSRDYSAAYCLPVLFHDITQRLLYRMGLQATGFVLNAFDMEHMVHSYKRGRNVKHSQGVQIRAVGKRDAGRIHVPKKHQDFCVGIYESMGVCCLPAETAERGQKELPPFCGISCKQDELQSSLEIRVFCIGADLPERIAALHKKYPLKGKQTANLFLNVSDQNAVWAYGILTEAGYFFTGLKPLCSEKEYMILHHPGEVEIFFEDYVLSKEFRRIADYVCKERRKTE